MLSTHLEFWVIIHKNCNYTNIWDITVHNKTTRNGITIQ